MPDMDKLKELAKMKEDGILTEEEFSAQKAALLSKKSAENVKEGIAVAAVTPVVPTATPVAPVAAAPAQPDMTQMMMMNMMMNQNNNQPQQAAGPIIVNNNNNNNNGTGGPKQVVTGQPLHAPGVLPRHLRAHVPVLARRLLRLLLPPALPVLIAPTAGVAALAKISPRPVPPPRLTASYESERLVPRSLPRWAPT